MHNVVVQVCYQLIPSIMYVFRTMPGYVESPATWQPAFLLGSNIASKQPALLCCLPNVMIYCCDGWDVMFGMTVVLIPYWCVHVVASVWGLLNGGVPLQVDPNAQFIWFQNPLNYPIMNTQASSCRYVFTPPPVHTHAHTHTIASYTSNHTRHQLHTRRTYARTQRLG